MPPSGVINRLTLFPANGERAASRTTVSKPRVGCIDEPAAIAGIQMELGSEVSSDGDRCLSVLLRSNSVSGVEGGGPPFLPTTR